MALASEDFVEDALGRPLTQSDDVITLLESASDLVVSYLGGTPDPVPAAVARVVGEIVAAVLLKPAVSTANYQASGYNVQRETTVSTVGVESVTSIGPWLTKSQKARLAHYRMSSARSAFTLDTDPGTDSPASLGVED